MKKQDQRPFMILTIPCLVVLFALALIPLIYAIYLSCHNVTLRTLFSQPDFIGIKNYVRIIGDREVLHSLLISGIFSTSSVSLSLAIGLGLALLLYTSGGIQKILRPLFLVPMIITPVVAGVSWRFMLDPDLGVISHVLSVLGIEKQPWLSSSSLALLTVILINVWQWTPLVMLIIIAGLYNLPTAVYEAAQVDGASTFQTLRYITLPLLKPVILIALIIRTMDTIKEFDTIFILTRGGPGASTQILSIDLYFRGFKFYHFSEAAALGIIVLFLIIFVSRYYIKITGEA